MYLELVSEGGTIPFSLNFPDSYALIAKNDPVEISCIFLSCHWYRYIYILFLTTQSPTSTYLANCFSFAHTCTYPEKFVLPTHFSVKSWSFFTFTAKMLTMLCCFSLAFFVVPSSRLDSNLAYYIIFLFLQKASDKYSCIIP